MSLPTQAKNRPALTLQRPGMPRCCFVWVRAGSGQQPFTCQRWVETASPDIGDKFHTIRVSYSPFGYAYRLTRHVSLSPAPAPLRFSAAWKCCRFWIPKVSLKQPDHGRYLTVKHQLALLSSGPSRHRHHFAVSGHACDGRDGPATSKQPSPVTWHGSRRTGGCDVQYANQK